MENTVGWNIVGRICRFKEPTIESTVVLGFPTARGSAVMLFRVSCIWSLGKQWIHFSCIRDIPVVKMFIWNSNSAVYPVLSLAALPQRCSSCLHFKRTYIFPGSNSTRGRLPPVSDSKTLHDLTGPAQMPHFCEDFPLNYVPPFPLSSPLIGVQIRTQEVEPRWVLGEQRLRR